MAKKGRPTNDEYVYEDCPVKECVGGSTDIGDEKIYDCPRCKGTGKIKVRKPKKENDN